MCNIQMYAIERIEFLHLIFIQGTLYKYNNNLYHNIQNLNKVFIKIIHLIAYSHQMILLMKNKNNKNNNKKKKNNNKKNKKKNNNNNNNNNKKKEEEDE